MSASAPTVACIGVAVVDAIFSVPQIPSVPVKVMAHGYEEVGGGMAATGAVAIRRLGGEAWIWGRLGADDVAERVVAGLEAEGVDASGLRRFPGRASTHAAVLRPTRVIDSTVMSLALRFGAFFTGLATANTCARFCAITARTATSSFRASM